MHRGEYPRPQLVRDNWLNLNGQWGFEFDDSNVGLNERWFSNPSFSKVINVPFAYQTSLSGINDTTSHDYVWYHRVFELPQSMAGKEILLHFGAVDYHAAVYINGSMAGEHEGGHTGFSFNITPYLIENTNSLVVRVYDPTTDETIPRGKQFWLDSTEKQVNVEEIRNKGIWYIPTTGIWQTVWLEAVDPCHIQKLRLTPDVDEGRVIVEADISEHPGKDLEITVSFKGEETARHRVVLKDSYTKLSLDIFNKKIFHSHFHNNGLTWSPESPNLFDVEITISRGSEICDHVKTYFGMRKVHIENGMVYLNNRPYYQKLVLDQGYWPQGLLTAPTDEDLKQDIVLAKEMGFNGCRKHQKVEDPRFLYWADTLGFLVWGECPSAPSFCEKAVSRLTREWIGIIERDYNHPCIVTWVPLNESWGVPSIAYNQQQAYHSFAMYYLLKSLDPTRLVISNDGWEMTATDILAIHNYNHGESNQKEAQDYYRAALDNIDSILKEMPADRRLFVAGESYKGQPVLLTEFGGIGFKAGEDSGWGYTSAANADEFLADYKRVMEAVFASKVLHGYCYTQLTDVEQEINGILTYDRKPKCDLEKINQLNNMWHVKTVKI